MISLFSGAGGLDIGLCEAGFTNRLSVEIDEDAQKTLKLNQPSLKLATPGDIHKLTPSELLRQSGLQPKELTLLAGGPPCQPFSKSGYWAKGDTDRLTDPRAETLTAYLDIVKVALPQVLLLENVKGIAYSDKDEGLQLLITELNNINSEMNTSYMPEVITVNASSYGVPQHRERVFIVANRDGGTFKMPSPTHSDSKDPTLKNTLRCTTAWDSIGDLDVEPWPEDIKPKGKWADLLPTIPEGQNYLWHTDRFGGSPLFGWRTRFWSFLLKLAKNQPSWTIQAQPGPATGPFHWKGRLLSIRELARLQTFPDSYQFVGDRRSAQKQIGNAVPPAMGELFGLEIRRQFFGEQVRRKLRLIPEGREDCPVPEVPKQVPEKFLEMVGSHKAHPGTGKGPGAVLRNTNNVV
ncbi:DNA-cytosine methyltransferase [Shewanella pealeana ATCC 700345]|uniref:DNA (cytosine-5-)-methyltransferase n=2 Tax=Shewanella pealeana TaxID=70864 RepID=A8H210_SHEPA|nr:DNA-cytosine methyltransferase [Shewanella pealeana ATCC 700345]